jgi:hypothetical protein
MSLELSKTHLIGRKTPQFVQSTAELRDCPRGDLNRDEMTFVESLQPPDSRTIEVACVPGNRMDWVMIFRYDVYPNLIPFLFHMTTETEVAITHTKINLQLPSRYPNRSLNLSRSSARIYPLLGISVGLPIPSIALTISSFQGGVMVTIVQRHLLSYYE